ncbi:SPOR domain-containing protein [Billgrantia azerbaijanica]|nr:SPOR domain-containing protein [Halomonas azerbaijanica]
MARRPPPKKRGATSSRRRAPRRDGFRLPGWVWGLGGLVAGFLLAQHQHGTAPWQAGQPSPLATLLPRSAPPESETEAAAPTKEPVEPRMPTFEFYTLLPESEVIAPRGEVASPAPPAPPLASTEESTDDTSAAQVTGDDPIARIIAANLKSDAAAETSAEPAVGGDARYMLQAASFRKAGDAEQLSNRLRSLSLMAQVSQVQTAGGETWHRVQVGPYDDTRELNRAQDLMVTQGIEPLLIRLQN